MRILRSLLDISKCALTTVVYIVAAIPIDTILSHAGIPIAVTTK